MAIHNTRTIRALVGFLFIILFALKPQVAKADIFDDIASALQTGKAASVSQYFDQNLALTTPGKSSVYSRNQAEQMLAHFLDAHPVKSFTLMHRGASAKGAKYAIGTLETSQGSFRVYFYLTPMVGGESKLQELLIEAM